MESTTKSDLLKDIIQCGILTVSAWRSALSTHHLAGRDNDMCRQVGITYQPHACAGWRQSNIADVFSPIFVGRPPTDAGDGLVRLENGELRHYNYGMQGTDPDGSHAYTIASVGHALTFDVASGDALIWQRAVSGPSLFQVPISLNDNLVIKNGTMAKNMEFFKPITGAGKTMTVKGVALTIHANRAFRKVA